MALGAHAVPVLGGARPVEPIVGRDHRVRIEIEPLSEIRIPGDRQALQATAGKRHQILLQRLVAEGVGDLEVGHFTIRTFGVDEKSTVAREEARGDALRGEDRVVEIAAHRLRRRHVHREVVVRALPARKGRLVARPARLAADKGGAGLDRLVGGLRSPLRITHAGTLRTITAVAGDADQLPAIEGSLGIVTSAPPVTSRKALPFDGPADVHLDDVVLDPHRKDIERPRRRWAQDITGDVEGGSVAGTNEAVLGRDPRDGAAEVGALAVEGEEAAVGEPREIETPLREGGHRPRFESVHRPGNDDRACSVVRRPASPRLEEIADDPHHLGKRHPPEQQPHPAEEGPPRWFGNLARSAITPTTSTGSER